MSVYKGQWPEKKAFAESDIQVTVDGQPLPQALAEMPGSDLTFGWGNFSPRASRKLLAYSILVYEIHDTLGLPRSAAHRFLIDIGDAFMDEQVSALQKQWSMSSEDIRQWIKDKYPRTWAELSGYHAAV